MHNGKIGLFLLLCGTLSLTAVPFGQMHLKDIERISYNELSPADQNELIKLAIFSGNINYIVPGTLAHSHTARTVLENEFGPQNWIKLGFMLSDKGIDAAKNALVLGAVKAQEIPLPEKRPIKLTEIDMSEETTPPPLPPRPQAVTQKEAVSPTPPPLPPRPQPVTQKEAASPTPPPLPPRPQSVTQKEAASPTPPPLPPRPQPVMQKEAASPTPPPLPPRPQVKQPVVQQANSSLPFSDADLKEQKTQLKKPAPSSQAAQPQKSYLEEALAKKFEGVNAVDQEESQDNDEWD